MFQNINVLPIILAAVADTVIGGLWYSPVLFGTYWMKEMGYKPNEIKGAGKSMGLAVVLAVVMAFIMSVVIKMLNIATIDGAIELAFLLWIGFVVPVSAKTVLFERTKPTVFAVTASYHLISMIVMAIILVSWK